MLGFVNAAPFSQVSYFSLASPESELYIEANRLDVGKGEFYVVSEDSDSGATVNYTEDNVVNMLTPGSEWKLEADNDLAFNPRDYYEYSLSDAESLNVTVPAYAGAGKLERFSSGSSDRPIEPSRIEEQKERPKKGCPLARATLLSRCEG